MRVEQRPGRGRRHFVIMLDREDARTLWGLDSLYGVDRESGIGFWLYSQLSSSQRSFVPMPPDMGGYQYTIGNMSSGFKGPKDLAVRLQQGGRVPINLPPVEEGRDPIDVGYVTFEFRPRADRVSRASAA